MNSAVPSFVDFSFSRFDFNVRTDTQTYRIADTETESRMWMIAILTRLLST